jgi:glutamate carboxypeptidase
MKMRSLSRFFLGLVSCFPLLSLAHAEIAPEYMQLLQQVVDINTDTRNTEGLNAIRKVLIPQFEALGFQVASKDVGEGHQVLVIERQDAKPSILLLGHLDTVFPKTSAFQSLRKEPNRLVGPGVIDMKGGIILMLNALRDLSKTNKLDALRIVLNDDEEIGSPYSKAMLRSLAQGMKYGLVFEPGLEDGALVKGQASVRWLRLSVEGRAAHAGLEPQNGINACVSLAKKISEIAALAEPERGLTVNPGVIEGGTKPNVVCEKASSTIDVRFRDQSDWEKFSARLEEIRLERSVYNELLQADAQAELKEIADLPLLPESATSNLVGIAQEAARSVGQTVAARTVGYGSDGNNIAQTGIQLLVGLGPYGGGMHTAKEHLLISAYVERLNLVKALLNNLFIQR